MFVKPETLKGDEPMTDKLHLVEDLVEPIYYENTEWAVTGYGIQRVLQPSYVVAFNGLGTADDRNRKRAYFPIHMAKKGWCNMLLLMPAFMVALGVARDRIRPQFPDDWYEPTMRTVNGILARYLSDGRHPTIGMCDCECTCHDKASARRNRNRSDASNIVCVTLGELAAKRFIPYK